MTKKMLFLAVACAAVSNVVAQNISITNATDRDFTARVKVAAVTRDNKQVKGSLHCAIKAGEQQDVSLDNLSLRVYTSQNTQDKKDREFIKTFPLKGVEVQSFDVLKVKTDIGATGVVEGKSLKTKRISFAKGTTAFVVKQDGTKFVVVAK